MPFLQNASWAEIGAYRERLAAEVAAETTLCAAAQRFVTSFVATFPSIALSRVFAVLPLKRLPEADAASAAKFAESAGATPLLLPDTPVLSLLGSCGKNPAWNDRLRSTGHLAIPLLSRQLVEGIPMIAQLLSDIGVDLACLDQERAIESRRLQGSSNQCFYVANAAESRDKRGRFIIPSQTFVAEYGVKTVFGMAGSYVDGTMLAAISFSTEAVEKLVIDRFPTIISNFKMATTALAMQGKIYDRQ